MVINTYKFIFALRTVVSALLRVLPTASRKELKSKLEVRILEMNLYLRKYWIT